MLIKIKKYLVKKGKRSIILISIACVCFTVGTTGIELFKQQQITYKFEIIGEMEEKFSLKEPFIEMVIRHLADHNDRVILTIDSPGGQVVPSLGLVNAIIFADANVIAHVPREAASMAALVVMVSPTKFIANDAIFVFHRARSMPAPNILIFSEPGADLVTDMMDTYTKHFIFPYLTEEEIALYWANEDVMLTGKDLRDRHCLTEL